MDPNRPDATGHALRWALRSKHPDRLEDYSILAESTRGRDVKELALLIRHSLPGTPKNTQSHHDGLPWVTFVGSGSVTNVPVGDGSAGGSAVVSGGPVAGGERLGVSVTEWKPKAGRARVAHEKDIAQDRTGQPITATRYFDVAFDSLGGLQPGYREIYAAVKDIELPLTKDIALPLAAANLDHLADDIEQLGFDWVATLAALLLERPVMIIGGSLPPIGERVRCLDAVAALLPYGFRADLVVGTWTPNSAAHDIRLAFADWAHDRQYQVAWLTTPDPTGFTETTVRYLENVRRLRHQHGGIAALVQRLWRLATPLPPGADAAETVLGYLEMEEQSHPVGARSGRIKPGEARPVMERTDPASLEPKTRHALLSQLAADGTTQDLALLDRWWSDEVLSILVEATVRTPTEALAVRYAALATNRNESARFCLAVVESVAADPDPARKARIGRVVGSMPPPANGQPELHAALLANQVLCLELIIRSLESDPSICAAWVRWLTRGPVTPGWLRPFAVAAGAGRPLDSGDVQALASWETRTMVAVLKLACDQGTMPELLLGIWAQLTEVAERTGTRRAIITFLAELPAQPGTTQALIDALLVSCESDQNPRGPASDPGAYVSTAVDLIRSIRPELRQRVIVPLVYGLTNPPPRPAGIALAAALAERLRPYHSYVLMGLQPAIEAVPGTLQDLSPQLQQELLEISPTLAARGLLDQLAAAVEAGADDEELVGLWGEGVLRNCSPEEVLRVLRRWPGATQPHRIYLMIESLVYNLTKVGHRSILHEAQQAHEAVLQGALGEQVAIGYRNLLRSVGEPLRLHSAAVNRALHVNGDRRLLWLERLKAARRRR